MKEDIFQSFYYFSLIFLLFFRCDINPLIKYYHVTKSRNTNGKNKLLEVLVLELSGTNNIIIVINMLRKIYGRMKNFIREQESIFKKNQMEILTPKLCQRKNPVMTSVRVRDLDRSSPVFNENTFCSSLIYFLSLFRVVLSGIPSGKEYKNVLPCIAKSHNSAPGTSALSTSNRSQKEN